MLMEEHSGKQFLAQAGIGVPRGDTTGTPEGAARVARKLGKPVVVKGQVPVGGRGRSGLIRFANDAEDAQHAAAALLGSSFGGYVVEQVLVEERLPVAGEFYAAVANDTSHKCPLVLFSTEGGMDIEEIHAGSPDKILTHRFDIRRTLDLTGARTILRAVPLEDPIRNAVGEILVKLSALYRRLDAELVEINPLALTACGESRSTSPILLAKGSTGSSAALTLWRMTMGTRDPEQPPLWIATSDLPVSPGHPFYTRLNALLDADSTRS